MTTPRTQCSTTNSFAVYGIPDGTELIDGAARQLGEPAGTVTVEGASITAVENAIRAAFLAATGAGRLPSAVDAALADAAATVADRYEGDELHVREEFLPALYREAAGYHCAYRTSAPPAASEFEG